MCIADASQQHQNMCSWPREACFWTQMLGNLAGGATTHLKQAPCQLLCDQQTTTSSAAAAQVLWPEQMWSQKHHHASQCSEGDRSCCASPEEGKSTHSQEQLSDKSKCNSLQWPDTQIGKDSGSYLKNFPLLHPESSNYLMWDMPEARRQSSKISRRMTEAFSVYYWHIHVANLSKLLAALS